MFKNIELNIEYFTGGFVEKIIPENGVVSWQKTTDMGISIRLSSSNRQMWAYLYLDIIGRGSAVLKRGEEIIGVLSPEEKYMCINKDADECELYIQTDFADIEIKTIQVFSYSHNIFPEPDKYIEKEGMFVLSSGCGLSCPEEWNAAGDFLKAELCIKDGKDIILEKDEALENEEFIIEISENNIFIKSGCIRGAFYASDVLVQLFGGEDAVLCAVIYDKPFMKIRGFHGGLPSCENMDFYKKFIKYVLVPMRYNTLFIQPTSAMQYDSYPEINKEWIKVCERYRRGIGDKPFHYDMLAYGNVLTKEQVRELVSYARSFGIEVIPEIQALGHVQYMTRAFPEIGETLVQSFTNDDINVNDTDERPESDISHCYCPENPKSYEILFAIIDEVLEVFGDVSYVHMGHDEVYEIGVCEKCKDIPPEELLYNDIIKIYNYLKDKGIKMMIWSDMLQKASPYQTVGALNKLPKDIIMLDFIWYFHLDSNIENNILKEGFEVVMGNMYSSHYPRFEERREAVLGAQTSTWVGISEKSFALEGKFFEVVYSGNMMWQKAYAEKLRECYSYIISNKLVGIRRKINSDFVRNYETESVCFNTNPKGVTAKHLCLEAGYDGCIDTDAEINIDAFADKVVFLHTADKSEKRIAWGDLYEVAHYTVCYDDGTAEIVPVEYGGNIRVWNKRYAQPKTQSYYRHEGYVGTYDCYPEKTGITYALQPYTIYGFEWYNKHPEKKIKSKIKSAEQNTALNVLLFGIKLLKKVMTSD